MIKITIPIGYDICACGNNKTKRSKICQKCARGSLNPAWKGDNIVPDTGRERARNLYALTNCEHCGKPGRDRHHKDSNALNNKPDNVEILCRSCHMKEDGRLLRLLKAGQQANGLKSQIPCLECGRIFRPKRKGLCGTCYSKKYRRVSSAFSIQLHQRTT